MKLLLCAISFFFVFSAFARPCEVYGISDSPQKLTCEFNDFRIALRCKSGKYFLNSSPVSMAFHMEVEAGPVPLVFKASDMELTVLMMPKADIHAELGVNGRVMRGTCL